MRQDAGETQDQQDALGSPGEDEQGGEPDEVDPTSSEIEDMPVDWFVPFDDCEDIPVGMSDEATVEGDNLNDGELLGIGQRVADNLLKDAFNKQSEYVALSIEVDHRNRERFMKNPSLFLPAELRNSEVSFGKLRPEDRPLFEEAMSRELAEFLQSEATRRCETAAETEKANTSGRCIPARWLLQWRPIAKDDREAAQAKRKDEGQHTTIHQSLTKKAKGRIVLIGFKHPDIEKLSYKTASPVASAITRLVGLQLSVVRRWTLEGCDASSAFLQSESTEEGEEIWMRGIAELAIAMGAEPDEALRVLKAVYGLSNAPLVFYKDFKFKLETLTGAEPILGDPMRLDLARQWPSDWLVLNTCG